MLLAVSSRADSHLIDSRVAWWRLAATLTIATLGGVGMWSFVVALPAVQAEFGVDRGAASLPYTLTMIGFGFGGILMGRLTDRFGVARPLVGATVALSLGYVAASLAPTLFTYALAHGLLIGCLGSSATFGPLLADISHWFERRRGLAVSIVACGNYLAGTVWPPIVQQLIEAIGWRHAHLTIGLVCLVTMLPLTLALRRRAPSLGAHVSTHAAARMHASLGVSPRTLQALLVLAGLSCCVAMSMPQVHIVAYCGDLGYGPAAGARMLSLMLGFGIVSRLASGWVADHIGGLRTLLLGSTLQLVALVLYLPFDGLTSLYVVSALFGMALGGWMSGVVFDMTGSYRAAFANGIAWNLLNLSIAIWLLRRPAVLARA